MTRREPDVDRHLPLPHASLNALLALAEGETHGYGIKHTIEKRTEGRIRLGAATLYGTLARLEKAGLVRSRSRKHPHEPGTSRWRYFRITPFGREVLKAELGRLDALLRWAKGVPQHDAGTS